MERFLLANATRLASWPRVAAAPGDEVRARGIAPDVVVFVSDNQSWADFRLEPSRPAPGPTRGTVMAEEWERIRARNPRAKLVLIDIQPYGSTQVDERDDGRRVVQQPVHRGGGQQRVAKQAPPLGGGAIGGA